MRERLRSLLGDPDFLARTARFIAVGLGCTALYFVVAFGLLFAQINVVAAHVVAYLVSLAVSYGAQKIVTFRIRGQHRAAAPRFLMATALITALQFLAVIGLNRLGADDRVTIAASGAFYVAASFLVHALWTFADPARTPRREP